MKGEPMSSALDLTNSDRGVLVDPDTAKSLATRRWRLTPQGYAASGHADLMHRVVAGAQPGEIVDHINGDKLDNRRCNLRRVSQVENQINRQGLNRNNTSGVRGVTWSKRRQRWIAQIHIGGKGVCLGQFRDLGDAAEARRRGEIEYFGEECPK